MVFLEHRPGVHVRLTTSYYSSRSHCTVVALEYIAARLYIQDLVNMLITKPAGSGVGHCHRI